MSDKFKPGDRVVGIKNWEYYGFGTVIRKLNTETEAYSVKFDKLECVYKGPHAKFLRKLTKLELALS